MYNEGTANMRPMNLLGIIKALTIPCKCLFLVFGNIVKCSVVHFFFFFFCTVFYK